MAAAMQEGMPSAQPSAHRKDSAAALEIATPPRPKSLTRKARSMYAAFGAKKQPSLRPGDSVLLPTLGTCRAWVRYVSLLRKFPI